MKVEGQNKVQVINWDNHRHRTNTFDYKCQKRDPGLIFLTQNIFPSKEFTTLSLPDSIIFLIYCSLPHFIYKI